MTDSNKDSKDPYIDSEGVQHYRLRTKALILLLALLFGATFWFSVYYMVRRSMQAPVPVPVPTTTLPKSSKLGEHLGQDQDHGAWYEVPEPTEPGIELPTVGRTTKLAI